MHSTLRGDGPHWGGVTRATAHHWRQSWETMMEGYLPSRDELLAVGLDAAEHALGRPPASVLDIGSGPGTTAEALLRRWPQAAVTVLDADPALLALAEAALPQVAARRADLGAPAWRAAAEGPYDLVLLVMTLHYLPERRARQLYAEIRELVRPGGTLLVADSMPANPEPPQSAADPHGTWSRWWQDLLDDPAMTRGADRRVPASSPMASADFVAPISWHEEAAGAAGFATCRPVWRRGHQAVLAVGAAT